jgi:hypothetical protein
MNTSRIILSKSELAQAFQCNVKHGVGLDVEGLAVPEANQGWRPVRLSMGRCRILPAQRILLADAIEVKRGIVVNYLPIFLGSGLASNLVFMAFLVLLCARL